MRPSLQSAWTSSAIIFYLHNALTQAATTLSVNKAMISEGCFTSSGTMVNQGPGQYQTSLTCQTTCLGLGMTVMGLQNGSNCWCGSALPAASSKVDASQCNIGCNGYGTEQCGGANAWTIYLTGNTNVGSVGVSGSSSAASIASSTGTSSLTSPSSSASSGSQAQSQGAAALVSSSAAAGDQSPTTTNAAATTPAPTTVVATSIVSMAPSVLTLGGTTVVRTIAATTPTVASAATSTPSAAASHHSSNTAGIAAGVVVGIVAVAAIIGGIVVYTKRKNRASMPAGHRRNASLGASAATGDLRRHVSDSRLDPAMVEKRRSGVSVFADNLDYSRRILKVTNPDGS